MRVELVGCKHINEQDKYQVQAEPNVPFQIHITGANNKQCIVERNQVPLPLDAHGNTTITIANKHIVLAEYYQGAIALPLQVDNANACQFAICIGKKAVTRFVFHFNATNAKKRKREELDDERPAKRARIDASGVYAWVTRLDAELEQYADLFQSEMVDEEMLVAMDDDDLKKMGIAKNSHRERLLEAVKNEFPISQC